MPRRALEQEQKLCDPKKIGTREVTMSPEELLQRITFNPTIFGGKPIIRGRRLGVEHVLGMLASDDSPETTLAGYPWLEDADIKACLAYAWRVVGHERVEPLMIDTVE